MATRGKALLTDSRIRAAKPRQRAYSLSDGGRLYLFITPRGSRLWRLRYGHAKTESMVSLGPYPEVTLSMAREQAMKLRRGLFAEKPLTPAAAKRQDRKSQANTFEDVAREWLGKQRYAEATIAKTNWLLSLLIPHLGNRAVTTLEPPDVLDVLRRIESRGTHEAAHRARSLVGKVMRYAIATSRATRDPAADLRDALVPVETTHHASLKDPADVGELLRALDGYRGRGLPVTQAALRLSPLVFVRPSELRTAEWSEFDLDSAQPIWRIPASRMKPVKGQREQHLVPLSRQAVAILREIHHHTGHGRLVFPAIRGRGRPMSENTINAALRSLGYAGDQMTGHGFRSTASTLLNEEKWNRDWIERQLAHGERDNVRAAYNHAEYLGDRRGMMQAWADYLDVLKAAGKPSASTP